MLGVGSNPIVPTEVKMCFGNCKVCGITVLAVHLPTNLGFVRYFPTGTFFEGKLYCNECYGDIAQWIER